MHMGVFDGLGSSTYSSTNPTTYKCRSLLFYDSIPAELNLACNCVGHQRIVLCPLVATIWSRSSEYSFEPAPPDCGAFSANSSVSFQTSYSPSGAFSLIRK